MKLVVFTAGSGFGGEVHMSDAVPNDSNHGRKVSHWKYQIDDLCSGKWPTSCFMYIQESVDIRQLFCFPYHY